MRVRVHLTPPPRASAGGAGCTGVAVDVLRATSTLAAAVANGVTRIVPFAETAEAVRFRDATPGTLACGEREGRKVAGFDLGNSPFEFGPATVGGRTLAFASTNGSRAMLALERCERVLLGAFVNAGATLEALAPGGTPGAARVEICCAGKLGRFAMEDAAFAGWLCAALEARGAVLDGPEARLVTRFAPRDADEVRARVEGASHARFLAALGPEFARDVRWCASLDTIASAASL